MPDQTSPPGDDFPCCTYTEGDLVIIDGRRWRVARISDDGRPSIRLIRMPTYDRVGTTVYADVLDQIGTRVPADRPAPIRNLTTDLRQLLAAATPGPFTVSSDSGVFANMQSLHRLAPGKDGWRERVASNVRSADAALIAGVLNALPVLLDALDEAEEASARVAKLEAQLDRVTDLFEKWAAEENEHRVAGEFGLAGGLHVAIEMLREAVHGATEPETIPSRRAQEAIARADREDHRRA